LKIFVFLNKLVYVCYVLGDVLSDIQQHSSSQVIIQ